MIRRLAVTDLVDGFDGGPSEGEIELTTFFRRFALKNQRRRLSATWVAIATDSEGNEGIVGFVTVCPGSVQADPLRQLDAKLPRYPAPVLLLARMATARGQRGTGIGSALVRHVCAQSNQLADQHGCVGVFTDARLDAAGFYEKMGFVRLGSEPGQTVPMCWLLTRK